MSVCRECGRPPYAGNPLDGEAYHANGCTTTQVSIPDCDVCRYAPWDCECEQGPTLNGRVMEWVEP
jgi:hypothetical protein